MTLRRLNNKNIDRKKWDDTVCQKGVGRIYFLSEYLDAVCRDWDAMVYGDYEVVMPLPTSRYFYFGRRFAVPLFVQQLGILGLGNDQADLRSQFLSAAVHAFPEFCYSFCHENGLIELNKYQSKLRTNFELSLQEDYASLRSNYSQNLIRNFRKSEGRNLMIRKSRDFELLKSFVQNHSKAGDPSPRHIDKVKKLCAINQSAYSPDVYSIWQDSQPWAVCFAPRFQNRITLLIPRSSEEGRNFSAMAILIDQIIRQHAGSEVILDFEGSMMPGVAQFYRGFGAVDRKYCLVSK